MDAVAVVAEVVWGIPYIREYKANATQFREILFAKRWAQAGVPAKIAGEYASRGYLPEEARPHLAAGRTAAEASAHDAYPDDWC